MFNISFEYPVVWNLNKHPVHEANEPVESWGFEIQDHDSYIYVSGHETSSSYTPEDAREMEHTSIQEAIEMTLIDGSSLTSEIVTICGEQYEVYQYFKDELYAEIGYYPPAYVNRFRFVYGDYLYYFLANIVESEVADQDDIIAKFYQMMESIECH